MADDTKAALLERAETLHQHLLILPNFSPPNPIAQPAAIEARINSCRPLMIAENEAAAEEETARNNREDLLKPFLSLFSDLLIYCKSAGWSRNDYATLASLNRELRGAPAETPAPTPENPPPTPENPAPRRRRSTAQTTYASRAATGRKIAAFLEAQEFAPAEERFKITNILAKCDELDNISDDIAAKKAASDQTRSASDNEFYVINGNLVDSCSSAKLAVKAIYKTKHPVWQQISKLTFRKPKQFRQ